MASRSPWQNLLPNVQCLDAKTRLLWVSRHSSIHTKLSFNILREVCSYLGTQMLIAVLSDEVKYFHPSSSAWTQLCTLQQVIHVNDRSSSTIIEVRKLNQIFVCGGGDSFNSRHETYSTAYTLEETGSVHKQPDMRDGRIAPGIIFVPEVSAVYVFGGENGYGVGTNTCDVFQLLDSKWVQLPNMSHMRAYFNPCRYASEVYLCGGGAVESFNLTSGLFRICPDFFMVHCTYCFSVMDTEGLVVITQSQICRWDLGLGRVKVTQNHEPYFLYSSCTPVVDRGVAYISALMSKACFGINLRTGVMEKLINL